MQPLVVIEVDPIRDAVASVFEADGASPPIALRLADLLVDSDLAGHPSHGLYRVAEYHLACRSGIVDPRGEPYIVDDTLTSTAVVDGGGTFGQIAAQFAAQVACDRAQSHGISAVALRNCSHVGRLANHVDVIADRGMIGIMTANDAGANLMVAPPGGREGRLGTNPFAFSVPRLHRPHLILDIATSTVAYGTIVINRRREETAAGQHVNIGQTTLEAFGGHKGFGLAILVDVLSGILSGAGWSSSRSVEESQGVFMIAIDPEGFCGRFALVQAVEEMVEWIKSSPPAGDEPVLVPGEASESAREESGGHIEIDPTTWNDLLDVFAETGIRVPPTSTS